MNTWPIITCIIDHGWRNQKKHYPNKACKDSKKKCLQMGIAKQGLYAYINLYKLILQQCLAYYGHWILFSKFKLNHHGHLILFNDTRYKQQKMQPIKHRNDFFSNKAIKA